MNESDPNKKPRRIRRALSYSIPAVAVCCLLLAGVLTFGAVTGESPILAFFDEADPVLTNEEVIERVSQLTELPLEGQPIVATVEDVARLAEQDGFYVGADAGDKIIVYPTDNRAIIYSIDRDVLVKDGSISGALE